MSKAQRQRKGLHWALSQPPPCGVNTQGQNINKLKQGKTEGKKKQTREEEGKEMQHLSDEETPTLGTANLQSRKSKGFDPGDSEE